MQTLSHACMRDTWCTRNLQTCPSHRLQCKLPGLSHKLLPPTSTFPGFLPHPLQWIWKGICLWKPGEAGIHTGISTVPLQCHRQKWLFYLLLTCRDFSWCQRWSCCLSIWFPVYAQKKHLLFPQLLFLPCCFALRPFTMPVWPLVQPPLPTHPLQYCSNY